MIDHHIEKLATPPLFQTLRRGETFVSSYGTSGGSKHILDSYIKLWGLSAYQMAGLLGLSHRSSYYRYSSGERRSSPLMCMRLLQLELLFQAGVELHRIRVVDWESDPITIFWHNGKMSSPDQATGLWPELPTPDNGIPAGDGAARLVLRSSHESTKQKKRPTFHVGRASVR